MSVLVGDVRLDARDPRGEPFAMLGRHEAILHPVPEEDRRSYVLDAESPGVVDGEVVVAPAVDPPTDGFVHGVGQVLGQLAAEHRSVNGREQRPERLGELRGVGSQ